MQALPFLCFKGKYMDSKEVKKQCKKCKYSTLLNNSEYVCYYIVITKQRRGCSPVNCERFEPKSKKPEVRPLWKKKKGRPRKVV